MSQQDAVDALDRTLKAIELRKGGVSYDEIARTLGYKTRSGAFYAVKAALKKVKQEPCKELIVLELERIDALFWAMYPKAKHGDYGAVDRCIRLMERRARLLGLDAPIKIAPTNPEGDEEFGADDRYLLGKLLSEPADSGTPGTTSPIDANPTAQPTL